MQVTNQLLLPYKMCTLFTIDKDIEMGYICRYIGQASSQNYVAETGAIVKIASIQKLETGHSHYPYQALQRPLDHD